MALPYKWFKFPFGVAGDLAAVPDTVQGDGSVSYPQGYGPDYALDPATQPAALNIERTKANQIYNDITTAVQYLQTGQVPAWIDATTNGGSAYSYPAGATVLYTDGNVYRSAVAANTATPGASANWVRVRVKLYQNTSFYVSTTGNDTTGDGSSGAPWRTGQKAWDILKTNYDLNGFVATIYRNAGTYTDSVLARGPMLGANGPASVVFDSTGGTVIINATGSAYQALYGAAITVQNQTMGSTGYIFIAGYGGHIAHQGNTFGNANPAQIVATNTGQVSAIGAYTIAGSAPSHFSISSNGFIVSSVAITLSGTPAFSSGFVNAQQNGTINANGTTFSGSATGPRYSASTNGVIDTAGGGANFFPGNSAGTTATGGQYN